MRAKNQAIKYLQGKASDRKGMGMELALLVLLVVFACSTLLVSSALVGKSNLQTQEQQLRQRLALDQLAESILAGESVDNANYAAFLKDDGQWTPVCNGDGITLPDDLGEDVALVITDLSGQPLLTVSRKQNTITQWEYH